MNSQRLHDSEYLKVKQISCDWNMLSAITYRQAGFSWVASTENIKGEEHRNTVGKKINYPVLKSECRCCNSENRKEGCFNELWFGRHIYNNA